MLLSAAAAILNRYRFDAYGVILAQTGSAVNMITYRGERFDFVILRLNLRARPYSAATGRFDRMDQFGGFLNSPISLHKYVYANADPLTFVDPSGMWSYVNVAVGVVAGLAFASVSWLGIRAGKPVRGMLAGGLLAAGIVIARIRGTYWEALTAGMGALGLAALITAAFEMNARNERTEAERQQKAREFVFTMAEAFSYAFFNTALGWENVSRGNLAMQSLAPIAQAMADAGDGKPDDGSRLVFNFMAIILQGTVALTQQWLGGLVRRWLVGAPPALLREIVERIPGALTVLGDALGNGDSGLWDFTWNLIKEGLGESTRRAGELNGQ